jgi:hypothetical protein
MTPSASSQPEHAHSAPRLLPRGAPAPIATTAVWYLSFSNYSVYHLPFSRLSVHHNSTRQGRRAHAKMKHPVEHDILGDGEAARDVQLIKLSHLGYTGVGIVLPLCTQIRVLDLSSNFIRDIEPLHSCIRLVKLDLHNNHIAELPSPQFWKRLRYLRILYLHGNSIGGRQSLQAAVQALASCPRLQVRCCCCCLLTHGRAISWRLCCSRWVVVWSLWAMFICTPPGLGCARAALISRYIAAACQCTSTPPPIPLPLFAVGGRRLLCTLLPHLPQSASIGSLTYTHSALCTVRHALSTPSTIHHAPRTVRHAPCTTHHAPRCHPRSCHRHGLFQALTLHDTPLSLARGYRHHVVNLIWSLRGLDHHVISDSEVIEGANFQGRWPFCLLLCARSAMWTALRRGG